MNYRIVRLSELDNSYLGQVTKIFGESFGHMFIPLIFTEYNLF